MPSIFAPPPSSGLFATGTTPSPILNPDKLSTFQASLVLAVESCDYERDWHCLLLENRRSQWTSAALKSGIRRGNSSRLSRLIFRREGGQNYYTFDDLRKWLKANKLMST